MANRKYNWEGLFSRRETTLERGVDYTCSQSAMSGMIRNNASRRGVRVRLVDHGDAITVEVRGEVYNPRAEVGVAG